MNLADLRKLTVKRRLSIRFPLSNGMECLVNEHGIAQVPALRAVPTFNLEEELAGAQDFTVEAAGETGKHKPKPRSCTRDEMSALAAAGGPGDASRDDHDE